MEYRDYIKIAVKYQEIVLFGKALIGEDVWQETKKTFPEKTVIYCDNDTRKQDGRVVFSPEDVYSRYPDALWVLCSPSRFPAMKQQLLELGVKEDNIIHYLTVASDMEVRITEIRKKVTPLNQFHLEVPLAEHCNLNCRSCNHFSSLADEAFLDYEGYEKDINKLSELFNGVADHIFLIGGEPLLNKEIIKFLYCTRKAFPDTDLSVFTNGILLASMPDDFYQSMRETGSYIVMTKYNINPEVYRKAEERCRQEGIRVSYPFGAEVYRFMTYYPLDLEGGQIERDMFVRCSMANSCITLKDHRLHTCAMVANIRYFNREFGTDLVVTDDDSIDFHKARDGQEILDALARPIPFCRYCKTDRRTIGHEWGITERKIEEWT